MTLISSQRTAGLPGRTSKKQASASSVSFWAEEQMRLIQTISSEPDERAALERDRVGDDGALVDVGEQAPGQRISAVPGCHLKQPEESRKRLRPGPVQQDRKDRQALRVLVRT